MKRLQLSLKDQVARKKFILQKQKFFTDSDASNVEKINLE